MLRPINAKTDWTIFILLPVFIVNRVYYNSPYSEIGLDSEIFLLHLFMSLNYVKAKIKEVLSNFTQLSNSATAKANPELCFPILLL